jgi:tetratricopeptide (TPR) repeat protein
MTPMDPRASRDPAESAAHAPTAPAWDVEEHDRRAAEFEAIAVSDPAEASRRFASVRAEFEHAGDLASAARAARAAINVFAHLGDPSAALAIAAHARRRARGEESSRAAQIEAARVLVAAMHPRAKSGNMRGALRAGARAVRELEALGEHALVARAELNLANVAKALGRPAEAAALLERVLAHGAAIDPIRGAALNALGESRVQLAEFARAIEAFDAAARIYEAQEGHLHAALARGNLAHTLAKAGDIEAALRAFRLARERFAALGAHAEACRLALEEAELLEDAGLVLDAGDLALDAGALALRHGLRAEEARAALVRGRIDLHRGDAFDALPHLDRARAISTALGDRIGMSQAEVARAACLARSGRLAEAVAAADAALAVAETPIERALALLAASFARRTVEVAERTAREASGAGTPASPESTSPGSTSLDHARGARALAATLGLPALEAEASLAESRAARLRASTGADAQARSCARTQALAAAREAVAGLERAQDRILVRTLRRSFLSHRLEVYHELASQLLADIDERPDATPRPAEAHEGAHEGAHEETHEEEHERVQEKVREKVRERVREALDVIERARDRTIVEALERTNAWTPREASDAHPLDPHESSAEVLRSASRAARVEARADLDRAIDGSSEPPRGAAIDAGTEAVMDAGMDVDMDGAPTASGASRFRSDADAVVFHEDGARLGAFLLSGAEPTGSRTIAFRSITEDLPSLLDCVARFRFQVARHLSGATAASPRAHAAGRAAFDALRAALFGSIAEGLRRRSARPIVIVPSPSLAGLPLGLLAPDEVLAATAPSLGIAARLDANARRARPAAPALVVGVADERTPGLAREARRIAGALGRDTVHLDGAAATRARFREALATASVAHVACHGMFPPDAPNLAGLLLADGWFGARDAHALASAPAELILSGCSTGLASDGAGEQWFGLLRGFAAAGTARMIASLWPVRDEDGERMMEALHAPGTAGARTRRLVDTSRAMLAEGVHPASATAFAIIGGATAFDIGRTDE